MSEVIVAWHVCCHPVGRAGQASIDAKLPQSVCLAVAVDEHELGTLNTTYTHGMSRCWNQRGDGGCHKHDEHDDDAEAPARVGICQVGGHTGAIGASQA